jgi:hypothetical protein
MAIPSLLGFKNMQFCRQRTKFPRQRPLPSSVPKEKGLCISETYQLLAYKITRCKTKKFTGNLKEGKNEAVPGEPGKMEYIQP